MSIRVGVVGAGRMGITLAHLNGVAGLDTVLKVKGVKGRVTRAREALARSLEREVQKGRETRADSARALEHVLITDELAALSDCDVVIEAIHEEVEAKRSVIREVEAVVGLECAVTSSTSSIPGSMLAERLRRPDRLVVTHYIWPAHRRRLVEMAIPERADPGAVAQVRALLELQGARAFVVPDRPGFVTTRALLAYLSESVLLVRDGALPTQVDEELEGFGWPMGPCRLMDVLGLRNASGLHAFLSPYLGQRIEGLAVLEPAVRSGLLGYASGKGFYRRDGQGWSVNPDMLDLIQAPSARALAGEEIIQRSIGMVINELAHCIAEHVIPDWETGAEAIDMAFDFPRERGGLLGYFQSIGPIEWQARLSRLEEAYGERFRAPVLTGLALQQGGSLHAS